MNIKQDDNIQLCHTPFPISNHSIVLCLALTTASWPAYRFPRRQVSWSGTSIFLRIFYILLWYSQSKADEAEIDVCLELPCFLHDPVNIGNLTSGPFAFLKPRFYICKFAVHMLLKLSLKDFEHSLACMWNE